MKKKGTFINDIVNFLFCLSIITCCIVMIYALIYFINNCIYLKNTITLLANNYQKTWSTWEINLNSFNSNTSQNIITSDNAPSELLSQIAYIENLIDYTMQLQDLEAKATSTNMMTFIYTFLSGTLIGVATYFTKKSSDSVKQIKENKALITDLDSRTLFANFYMHLQRTYSTIQIFVLSLDSIQDEKVLSDFINKYMPKINDFLQEFVRYTEINKDNIYKINKVDQQNIIEEINGIADLIYDISLTNNNTLILDQNSKDRWNDQLRKIKRILNY